MELHPGSKQKEVGELLEQLLSRDAVIYNSAINSNFAPNVTYSGHTLKFRGASNLKHFAWLFNGIFIAGPATFDTKDIEWSEETNSATIPTIRYLRPRVFPLFGFAVPVKTHLRFKADGGDAGKGSSPSKLYVTKYEERWIGDSALEVNPFVAWLYTAVMTPIFTLLILALSNIVFAANARVTSSKRQYIDNSVDALSVRAKKAVPADVASNVGSGYQRGEALAQGWGTSIVNVVNKTTYPLLSSLEVISQRGVSALPVSLPYPFIYDAHSHPPSSTSTKKGSSSKKSAAPAKQAAKPPTSSQTPSAPSQDHKSDEKMAKVVVAPALDSTDHGKTVQIASRINTETEDEPALAKKPETDNSLYAQLKRDGDLPGQQSEAQNLSVPGHSAQGGASSEEDDHSAHGANGAPKKKKSGSKKKKGGVSHVHPPSFKEGLHQVEEQEQAQQAHN